MVYKVIINIPERPEGDLIDVPPLGLLENGLARNFDISEEEARRLSNGYGIVVESVPDEPELEEEEGGEEE